MASLCVPFRLTNLLGWWGQSRWMEDHCCRDQSHRVHLSGSAECSPQASWGFRQTTSLSQRYPAILGQKSLRNLEDLVPAWPGTREKQLGQPLTAQACQQLIPRRNQALPKDKIGNIWNIICTLFFSPRQVMKWSIFYGCVEKIKMLKGFVFGSKTWQLGAADMGDGTPKGPGSLDLACLPTH